MAKKNMSLTKVPMPEQAPDVRNKNFEEVALGYTAEMAMEEAARCLNCKNKPCKWMSSKRTNPWIYRKGSRRRL